MTLSVSQCLDAIRTHTLGLAGAAEGNLGAQVEHCPDWTVGDLVHHLTTVHTFWEHVARTRPLTEPTQVPDVPRAEDDELVARMTSAMERLLETLGTTDQQEPCWTWGLEENVWFITRHQVQEAAVHHWDAANAAGASWSMSEDLAADAVDEFLTHSAANRRWPAAGAAPLGEPLSFTGSGSWRILDAAPGTLTFDHEHDPAAWTVHPEDLLLWLYRRTPSTASTPPAEDEPLVQRFRAFTNTD